MLKTRSFWGYIGLTIITLGIYGLYWVYAMTRDINEITKADNKSTSPGLALLLWLITCGIYPIFWLYILGDRMQQSGVRMGVQVKDSGGTYILWYLLGAFIVVGPFVAIYKLIKNYNNLAVVYNSKLK